MIINNHYRQSLLRIMKYIRNNLHPLVANTIEMFSYSPKIRESSSCMVADAVLTGQTYPTSRTSLTGGCAPKIWHGTSFFFCLQVSWEVRDNIPLLRALYTGRPTPYDNVGTALTIKENLSITPPPPPTVFFLGGARPRGAAFRHPQATPWCRPDLSNEF